MGIFARRYASPRAFASVSLRPIRASSGSVNRQNGTCRPVVTWWTPLRLSRTTRKSSSAMCVNCGLPAQSPTAHTSAADVRSRSSTFTKPRSSVSTPASSSPIFSVFGARPLATRRCVPSIATVDPSRVACSPTDSPDDPSTRSMLVPVRTSIPSSSQSACRASETSGSSRCASRSFRSTMVTRLPKRRKAWASSRPTYPPPRIRRWPGRWSRSRASMCVRSRASRRPGIGSIRARVPVLITTILPRRTRVPPSASVTSIARGATNRPWPITSSAPLAWYFWRCIATRPSTIMRLRSRTAGMSTFPPPPTIPNSGAPPMERGDPGGCG